MTVPYLTYFNLKEEPFNTTANPRFFFQSPIHSTALGKAEFTVDAKKGLSIVFGDTGYGKSTLNRSTGDSYTRYTGHTAITRLHGLLSVPMSCGLI